MKNIKTLFVALIVLIAVMQTSMVYAQSKVDTNHNSTARNDSFYSNGKEYDSGHYTIVDIKVETHFTVDPARKDTVSIFKEEWKHAKLQISLQKTNAPPIPPTVITILPTSEVSEGSKYGLKIINGTTEGEWLYIYDEAYKKSLYEKILEIVDEILPRDDRMINPKK